MSADVAARNPSTHGTLGCPYCTATLPAALFVPWPGHPRLYSAECTSCHREVTVPVQWITQEATPHARAPQ